MILTLMILGYILAAIPVWRRVGYVFYNKWALGLCCCDNILCIHCNENQYYHRKGVCDSKYGEPKRTTTFGWSRLCGATATWLGMLAVPFALLWPVTIPGYYAFRSIKSRGWVEGVSVFKAIKPIETPTQKIERLEADIKRITAENDKRLEELGVKA